MATCGELLVRLLAQYGVDTVFGIPGVHTVELYRGLPGSGLRHVTPRHEQGAGFMADGYARASGRPGVCFIITGPGMTNIVTAMGQAAADSVPMLVISSVNERATLGLGHGHLHELAQQRNLIAGVSAFSHTLMRPDELPELLARAFTVFDCSRPRPVHIEIPIDVITAPADHVDVRPRSRPGAPGPSPAALGEAAGLIRAAQRIVLLAGGGAVTAAAALRELAERLGAPVALTNNARGLLPADHPLLLDGVQSLAVGRALFDEADLVIAIGTELGATDYDLESRGPLRLQAPLVRIDIDPLQVAGAHAARVGIISDARLALAGLLTELGDLAPRGTDWAPRRTSEVNAAARNDWTHRQASFDALLATLRDCLPAPIIVGDSTQPVYQGLLSYRAPAPRSWFNSATGYGTLGYALPAAIGAKLAQPERPVVALIGDGGLQFTLPELIAAREAGTGIIVALWNNQGYGEILEYMQRRRITPLGVEIATPDFHRIAAGMGVATHAVASRGALAALLGELGAPGEPVLIEMDAAGDW